MPANSALHPSCTTRHATNTEANAPTIEPRALRPSLVWLRRPPPGSVAEHPMTIMRGNKHTHPHLPTHSGGTKRPYRFHGHTLTEPKHPSPPPARERLPPLLFLFRPSARTHGLTYAHDPWKSAWPNSANNMTSAMHTPHTARPAANTDDKASALEPHALRPSPIPLHHLPSGSDHGPSYDHHERNQSHTPPSATGRTPPRNATAADQHGGSGGGGHERIWACLRKLLRASEGGGFVAFPVKHQLGAHVRGRGRVLDVHRGLLHLLLLVSVHAGPRCGVAQKKGRHLLGCA